MLIGVLWMMNTINDGFSRGMRRGGWGIMESGDWTLHCVLKMSDKLALGPEFILNLFVVVRLVISILWIQFLCTKFAAIKNLGG